MKRLFRSLGGGPNRITFRLSALSGLLLAVAIVIGVYLCVPGVKPFIQNAVDSAYDPSELRHFVMAYEACAPAVILLLTVLQGVITILPLCIVMMVSAMVLGLFRGVVVSVVSQVIAGYLAMRLTWYLSRPVARLIPFGSFDLVNFAAGFLNVRDGDFIVGTLIGVIPATCFYGFVGANLYNIEWSRFHYYYMGASLIVVAAIAVYSIAKSGRALRS